MSFKEHRLSNRQAVKSAEGLTAMETQAAKCPCWATPDHCLLILLTSEHRVGIWGSPEALSPSSSPAARGRAAARAEGGCTAHQSGMKLEMLQGQACSQPQAGSVTNF